MHQRQPKQEKNATSTAFSEAAQASRHATVDCFIPFPCTPLPPSLVDKKARKKRPAVELSASLDGFHWGSFVFSYACLGANEAAARRSQLLYL
ncbi:hypothetical protein ACLKA6_012718 [Drosophila palustris]